MYIVQVELVHSSATLSIVHRTRYYMYIVRCTMYKYIVHRSVLAASFRIIDCVHIVKVDVRGLAATCMYEVRGTMYERYYVRVHSTGSYKVTLTIARATTYVRVCCLLSGFNDGCACRVRVCYVGHNCRLELALLGHRALYIVHRHRTMYIVRGTRYEVQGTMYIVQVHTSAYSAYIWYEYILVPYIQHNSSATRTHT